MSYMDRARHVLQHGTAAERATVLRSLGSPGEVDEDVVALVAAHMDDRSVTRMYAPFRYGELRYIATEAHALMQFRKGRREAVVMKDATRPMSLDKLAALCDSSGISRASGDPVDWYLALRDRDLLPKLDEIFDPLVYDIEPPEAQRSE
jgi:hypothetical protein